MDRLTLKEARAAVAAFGFSLVRNRHGEVELSQWVGDCLSTYYTNDLQDAVDTARAEHVRDLTDGGPGLRAGGA